MTAIKSPNQVRSLAATAPLRRVKLLLISSCYLGLLMMTQPVVAEKVCNNHISAPAGTPLCNGVSLYGTWSETCGDALNSDGSTAAESGCNDAGAPYTLTTYCCNEKGEAHEQTMNLDPNNANKGHCAITPVDDTSSSYATSMSNDNGTLICNVYYK